MSHYSFSYSDTERFFGWLACYQYHKNKNGNRKNTQVKIDFIARNEGVTCEIQDLTFLLPSGGISLLNITLQISDYKGKNQVDDIRKDAIRSALTWQKEEEKWRKKANEPSRLSWYYILSLTVCGDKQNGHSEQRLNEEKYSDQSYSHSEQSVLPLAQHFGAQYFLEDLIFDDNDHYQNLQVLNGQDWQYIMAHSLTPCELIHFLHYHQQQLQLSLSDGVAHFDSERSLFEQFMESEHIFSPALIIDNALVQYGMQDRPNAALVAMSLAQRNKNVTAQMYQQHLLQSAVLWEQLCSQVIESHADNAMNNGDNKEGFNVAQSAQWQQQLLDESLFSRHELIRMLYQHAKQSAAMQASGYVIHQHSYSSLGRHYVMIFYGNAADAKQNQVTIRPNLQKVALDIATRLPLAELHHIIVLGINFIKEDEEVYIDMDTWVQPVNAMSQKERQLTKKLQHLSQQQQKSAQPLSEKLPQVRIHINVPSLK